MRPSNRDGLSRNNKALRTPAFGALKDLMPDNEEDSAATPCSINKGNLSILISLTATSTCLEIWTLA
jgi:hypothetical protein